MSRTPARSADSNCSNLDRGGNPAATPLLLCAILSASLAATHALKRCRHCRNARLPCARRGFMVVSLLGREHRHWGLFLHVDGVDLESSVLRVVFIRSGRTDSAPYAPCRNAFVPEAFRVIGAGCLIVPGRLLPAMKPVQIQWSVFECEMAAVACLEESRRSVAAPVGHGCG